LSDDAPHESAILDGVDAVAVGFVMALGGVVSLGGGGVDAEAGTGVVMSELTSAAVSARG
jgi:hypothetical protein